MLLKEATFTVFDFETTGLSPYSGDRICEIGAIKIGPGTRKKKFHSMVDPEMPLSRGAFYVNRITPAMLKGAPTIDKVLPDFMRFIKGTILVAYNAGFDIGFLECAIGSEQHILDDYHVIDALRLARMLFPGLRRYNLGAVAASLGIVYRTEHRAMVDVNMTLKIFQKELKLLSDNGAETVQDIAVYGLKKKRPDETVKDYRIDMIRKAIAEEKRLHITYKSYWKNEKTKRVISPKEIRQGYGTSYVVGYCHLRKGERNFRLDGIIDVEPDR